MCLKFPALTLACGLLLSCQGQPETIVVDTSGHGLLALDRAVRALPVALALTSDASAAARLCAGQTDAILIGRELGPVERARCDEAGIKPKELIAGVSELVIVGHPKGPLKTLSPDELVRLLTGRYEAHVTRFDQLRSGLPRRAIRLYGPPADDPGLQALVRQIDRGRARVRRGYRVSHDGGQALRSAAADPSAIALVPAGTVESSAVESGVEVRRLSTPGATITLRLIYRPGRAEALARALKESL